MPKKSKPSDAEMKAFQEAVKDAKPMVHNKTRLTPALKTRKRSPDPIVDDEIFGFSNGEYLPSVRGEEFISYATLGVSHKILRKLRKGQYNVEVVLDLHGLTVDEARLAVDGFLQQCLLEGVRVGLIIHGKGLHSDAPILKNKLNHWLREAHVILAFCSALPNAGNRGAVYVLFKRAKEEKLA